MGGVCDMIGVEDKCIQVLRCGGREEKIQLWKHKLNGRIILKWTFWNWNGRRWSGFNWLRIDRVSGLL